MTRRINTQPILSVFPLSLGDRVKTRFKNGKWYDGKIHGNLSKGHLVLFDGYESYGSSEIPLDTEMQGTLTTTSAQTT